LNESSGKSIIVANITSGAANKAIYGWSAYGSAKASINAYTTTVGKEQSELNTNNKIFAFSPGVMDNDMQKHIREKDKEAFIEVVIIINNNISILFKYT